MTTIDPEKRAALLEEIIGTDKPSNQAEVVRLLKKKHGIKATQAMISRDLKRLGIVMKQVEGKRVYAIPEKDTEVQLLRLAVKKIEHNETMIVITTHPGLAPFVGDMVDEADLDILGCLAGENAVFLVPRSVKKIKETFKNVCKAMGIQ